MAALQGILAQKQNITGGAWEALSPGTGDSFTIANFPNTSRAYILDAWSGNGSSKCQFSIRSPRMHDNVRGIRLAHQFNPTLSGADGDPQILLPSVVRQPLYSSDTLVIEVNGTALDEALLTLLVYYEDLPGADAMLYTWEAIEPRIANIVGILNSPTAGAACDYGTSVALNASDDRLKADTYYAVLGAVSDLPCHTVGIRGPDTGNYRCSLPMSWDGQKSSGFFVDMAREHRLPLIPVINANNKGATLVDAADVTNTAPNVTWILAELS